MSLDRLAAADSRLLITRLSSAPDVPHPYVEFGRGGLSAPTSVHPNLASILWTADTPMESISSLADIVFVSLRRTPGISVQKWDLEQEIVLDRYLTHNAVSTMQVRAQQSAIQGELKRLKEQAEHLSSFRVGLCWRSLHADPAGQQHPGRDPDAYQAPLHHLVL